ncbi:MAG: pantoate--beta-alanine ligase [Bacteroidetes bacterium]|nr:MAG: pantoate--beta-alanine ligase [Bacteroidota bacterium]
MKVIRTISQMQALSLAARKTGKSIGFVPTMGALHSGHLHLVERALAENDIVVCSIFVNPIQFTNPGDLEKYPRTFGKDSVLLEAIGCDVVFYPDVAEMYPEPVTHTYDFGMLEKVMEGLYRAGHFNGVAIVVKKLFDIVLPHKAYFGEKDYQQLAVIQSLVKLESMDIEIIPCPIVREPDGLAMSSRNARLTPEQRKAAPFIFETLVKAAQLYKSRSVELVIDTVCESIAANPDMELEYFEISDTETLAPIRGEKPHRPVVACIAVYMGQVRLIDNMIFNL